MCAAFVSGHMCVSLELYIVFGRAKKFCCESSVTFLCVVKFQLFFA